MIRDPDAMVWKDFGYMVVNAIKVLDEALIGNHVEPMQLTAAVAVLDAYSRLRPQFSTETLASLDGCGEAE